ncbi:MAG: protein translocase subunit SecD, partial [Flavobacteriales bacterium]|nr:protein translocase subunit SecD [Flavobacteriales bacterium]
TDTTAQTLEDLIGDDITLDEEGDDEPQTVERDYRKNPLLARLNLGTGQGGPAAVGFAEPHDTAGVNEVLALDAVKAVLPQDLMLMWSAKSETLTLTNNTTNEVEDKRVVYLYALQDASGKGKSPLDGAAITNASVGYDFNTPVVNMTMDAATGAPVWLEMTRDAAARGNRAIAITMDNYVYSAPSVENEIPGGRSRITLGQGSANQLLEEAEDLSQLLKAGSLPAPAKIVDEYTVGPTLGEENINSGMLSFGIALLVILIYMIFYYKGAGVVSNIALIANLFFLVGALASIGAALTLPGIAGIVLTIGMAVDANVLIFERIREEMRHGKGLAQALKDGYNKAYSAIVDANITTLLTAIILFAFGSGPIQGFATTLIIGIFTSLFSAIVITRLIFFNRLEKKKGISFSTELTKNWFTNLNFQFVKKRKMFYVISGVVIVAGVASLLTRGVDYGVDFEGGTRVDVAFEQAVERTAIENALEGALVEEGGKGSATIQAIGADGRRWKIESDFMINSEAANRDEVFDDALSTGLAKV